MTQMQPIEQYECTVSLGDTVKRWREYRGLTLNQFAKIAQISKGYISDIEHNRINQPKAEQLVRLAAGLNISVRELISCTLPPNNTYTQSHKISSPANYKEEATQYFEQQIHELISDATLTPNERLLAQNMVLETARAIIKSLEQKVLEDTKKLRVDKQ